MTGIQCREIGHDWQTTVETCSRCRGERITRGDVRTYRFPNDYDDILAAYDNCENLGHAWRHVTATKTGDVIRQLLTCDRCLAKMAREMLASTGELISETVVPPAQEQTP